MLFRNKKIKFFLVGFSALCALALGVRHAMLSATHVATDDAYIQGRIHSIAPKISGTVRKVYASDNQLVKKGDLLAEIDPVDYELKASEAQAALDTQRARLLDAEAGVRAAAANVTIQEVTLAQATLDRKRAEALFKEEVITRERYEKAATAYGLAQAQVKAATEQLERSKSQKALEESAIRQKEASLKISTRNVSYAKIFSPSDGAVTGKSVEEGNQIQAGQPLMAVIALDDIWLVANYKETQLKNVRPGQKVLIKVDTYPGKIFTGKVDSIMAGTGAAFSLFPPENALGNYVKVVQRIPVKIVFDKESGDLHGLRIGMSCLPTIITNE